MGGSAPSSARRSASTRSGSGAETSGRSSASAIRSTRARSIAPRCYNAPRMGAAELAWQSAHELARRIRSKEISPVEVMGALLDRIAAVNPTLNAYCTVAAEEARDAATAAEVALLSGEALGPLHGVPVSVKDLIFTRRLLTTAGSRLLADHVPEEDAVAVERLRGAGALIVGKTNTPEFGFKGVTDN